jgi:hypothetical protein
MGKTTLHFDALCHFAMSSGVAAPSSQTVSGRPMRKPAKAGLHLALGVAVFVMCLAAPRVGAEILLVPVGLVDPAERLHAVAPDAGIVGPGGLRRSLIAHFTGPVPFFELLRSRVLAIAVPAALCGGAGSANTEGSE